MPKQFKQFKLFDFNNFIFESSLTGLKSTRIKKQKTIKRLSHLNKLTSKNQIILDYYKEKEKYEAKKALLDKQIEKTSDNVRKAKLKDTLSKLKEAWKKTKENYKSRIKHARD